MFPIPWNFPFRKKNGNLVNIGDAIDEGTELPEHGTSDAGKVLSVDENGDLEWSDEVNTEIQALSDKLDDEVTTRATLGAHNLYKFDLAVAKAANTSGTWNDNVYTKSGATFTVNDDNTITVNTNGTTTEELYFKVGNASLENGKQYKIVGCPSGGSNNSYLMAYKKDNSTYAIDTGNGASFTYASTDNKSIEIYIRSGQNLVDVVFKPMINLATDPSTDFGPYTMTNRELTDIIANSYVFKSVDSITITAEANDTWATMIEKSRVAINNYLANLGDNEYVRLMALSGSYSGISQTFDLKKKNDSFSGVFIRYGYTNSYTTSVMTVLRIASSNAVAIRTNFSTTTGESSTASLATELFGEAMTMVYLVDKFVKIQ